MFKFFVLIIAAVMFKESEACCCLSREPWMTQTCLECLYGLGPLCSPVPPKCKCFKDIKSPLSCAKPCQAEPSCGKYVYFPQVEYPCTCMDVNPFYYNSCFCSC